MSIEHTAVAPDGTAILTRHWPAGPGLGSPRPWAHVLLVHGLGEHSGRYEHVGAQLAAAGLDVHAYDHRGNGASGGTRGHVDRWSRLHDDLAWRHAAVRGAAGGRPVVLYGHSMGGLVVAGYCLAARPRPDAVVLSSPGLDSTLAAWKKALAALAGRFLPRVSIPNGVDPATLSRDPSVGARLAADPRCVTTSTLGFGAEGLREQARVRAAASGGLGPPTLVLHGEDDGLVPVGATSVFEGAPRTTRRTFPGLRHELHNEPEGPAIVDGVVTWLRAQLRDVTAATGTRP
jgi:alpha-beta hydrolase superfamily lysophospholipase